MLECMSPPSSLGVHPGFGRRDSDVGARTGTVDVWPDGVFMCRVSEVHLARLNQIDSPSLSVKRTLVTLSHRSKEVKMRREV